MWKDFFYFSKGQRTGIIVLLILIVVTIAACYLWPVFTPAPVNTDDVFLSEAESFERNLVSRDSLRKAEWDNKYQRDFEKKEPTIKAPDTYSLFRFDPNKVDSAAFVRLGLKPFIASNILKFRAKGGIFRTVDSFSKVYGILPEKFKELEPYIAIAEPKPTAKDSLKTKSVAKQKNHIVELNSADTTELMQVYGIGRGYAKAIVRFRQQTGGFVSVEQLRELFGMTDANFDKISPNCTVNQQLVRKIAINNASVEKLNAHPYLNFYESKAIYEFRRRKGKLNAASELSVLSEIKPETLRKITPYLSFE
jgi:competence ComEA-like helix-hairpin-helix protein